MAKCAVKRGLFVLRPCGNPAYTACGECRRSVCAQHYSIDKGVMICVECSSKGGPVEQTSPPAAKKDGESKASIASQKKELIPQPSTLSQPDYAYRYRRNFYTHYHYPPFYIGLTPLYFDDYDTRSFDADGAHAIDGMEDSEADLYDS